MTLLALALASFGLFLIALAVLLLNDQRKSQNRLDKANRGADGLTSELDSPEEKAERQRREDEVEKAKKEAFDLHDDGT